MAELLFPLRGKHVGAPAGSQPPRTSRDLNNVRPFYDGRAAGGQRPGLSKRYTQQIGGGAFPIVAIVQVSTVLPQ